MTDSYEDQAKAKLAELSRNLSDQQAANIIAHAQVLATLEIGERIWKLDLTTGRRD